jgi:osmotically-inducible protein OsmY
MASNVGDRGPRGMFGYEGEGFTRGYADAEGSPERGWNIGSGSDRPSYRGRGPKNYRRSDERIREEICERLTMDHDVDASEIEIAVSDGVVSLSGSVNERQAKRIAEDICDSVRGVKDVQNTLRVTR